MADVEIKLTRGDYEQLLIVLGYATGAAWSSGNPGFSYAILRLANVINRDNPNWIPYQIPDEPNHA